ncbi:MAG: hypothetical protein WCR48_04740, partial [Bacteroidales bacterium]
MSPREKELIDLIHKEVKPALGCTEPIAVALATAKAVETLADGIGISPKDMVEWRLGADFSVKVEVSGNILKNGMGVGVPGTGMIGLPIAAALGAVCGKSALSLEVLHDLCEKSVGRAKELYNKGDIDICLSDTCKKLYVKAIVSLKGSAD